MSTAIILMTALIPTTGHRDIIAFASDICDNVKVMVSTLSFEPKLVKDRVEDIRNLYKDSNVEVFQHQDDTSPQNPEDHDDFWNWWAKAIKDTVGYNDDMVIIASELYGKNLAETLNCKFIPYDIGRNINAVRGSDVRNDIIKNWNQIILPTRRKLLSKVVLFGQESVGKTTLAKKLSNLDYVSSFPEYARGYLEAVGSEVTDDKMIDIAKGQAAIQRAAFENPVKPLAVFDTDLFSTIGYTGIYKGKNIYENLFEDALNYKSDMYYILPDDCPMVQDVLRYGGDKRESSLEYWIDICHMYNLPYNIVPSGTWDDKKLYIQQDIDRMLEEKFKELKNYVRT